MKMLANAIEDFKPFLVDNERAYALLYTPRHCHLALLDRNGQFFNEGGEFAPRDVFEARLFNEKAELRWLHYSNGDGKVAIISDDSIASELEPIDQTYLVWGKRIEIKSNETNPKGWTKFGSARVGAFYVPIETTEPYSRFKALEYLQTYEDGNVAVVDERLIGIEGYGGGE